MQEATTLQPPSRAATLSLVGGAPCLDFANTSSGRGTPLLQEHLRSYDLLLAWSEHAALITAADRRRLSRLAGARPAAANRVLRRALALREAIHAVGAALGRGGAVPATALRVVNQELAAAMMRAKLRTTDGGFAWDWAAVPLSLDSVLRPIVRSFADILLLPQQGRIKQCPGHGCGWLFLDLTKSRTRRWCDMSVCGSRDKVRRYRDRQRVGRRRGAC